MGRTACIEPQCLYKGALYFLLLFLWNVGLGGKLLKILMSAQNVKGIAVPLEAWSGPEVSRKLRFPDFMTTVQDGGKVVSLTHRPPLPTENAPGTHFC